MSIGRLGFTESTLLFCYYLRNQIKIDTTPELVQYEASFIQWLFNTSGFCDPSFNYNYNYIHTDNYKKLMNEFYQMSKESTIVRFAIHDSVFSKYLPDFNKNFNVGEFNFESAFTEFNNFIRDKNVLIINPMSVLMKSQYDNGNVFKINDFTRVNKIECYKNKYTFFNNSSINSFEYVQTIIEDINKINYDCVIICCGSISSLIANRIDKPYLIIGSNLQTFFGIKHGRINHTDQYNEYWIDVPDEYKPDNYKLIENGCYW
jgi:hypothetical protein